MKGQDLEMRYEYFGRFVFNTHGKGTDAFGLANADYAHDYYAGSLEGKKDMSLIIARLVFESQQNGKEDHFDELRRLYEKLWALKDNSENDSHSIEKPLEILNELINLSRKIINRPAYNLD